MNDKSVTQTVHVNVYRNAVRDAYTDRSCDEPLVRGSIVVGADVLVGLCEHTRDITLNGSRAQCWQLTPTSEISVSYRHGHKEGHYLLSIVGAGASNTNTRPEKLPPRETVFKILMAKSAQIKSGVDDSE